MVHNTVAVKEGMETKISPTHDLFKDATTLGSRSKHVLKTTSYSNKVN